MISKFGNVKEKLEIIEKNQKLGGGGNCKFRNEFGMKNDNWKYFGHLEIIWKIGKIVNWEIFWKFWKNWKSLQIQKKNQETRGKNWTFGKKMEIQKKL